MCRVALLKHSQRPLGRRHGGGTRWGCGQYVFGVFGDQLNETSEFLPSAGGSPAGSSVWKSLGTQGSRRSGNAKQVRCR